ncbi:S8 family serine peptidase [Pseudoxanthomonas wuyuanensis]
MYRTTGSPGSGAKPFPALLLGVLLSACGGGGGNVRSEPPISPPPTAPPPSPPVVEAPNPAYSRHFFDTNAQATHDAGFTGAGIRIGIVDSGVNRDHPALQGRVIDNLTYISGANNNLSVDDVVGHGTAVAQTAAGSAFGQWPGGIAPGAEIVSARIISDSSPSDDGSGEGNEVDGALGLKPIHQDLIDRGVQIMNNSWGGLYWTNPDTTAAIADEYRPFIVGNGGLVVFATGNSSFADPSDMAALPSQPGPSGSRPAADLERGWLAVAALDESDPTLLASYSNACGIAMNYCLAAPGTVVVTGTDDAPDSPGYWKWSGTSLAAPLVSGAAALVWEAFPYFDNDLVRQTLLGTATDLGEPGVDPVFGYGGLNVGQAVRGPARFDWGDVTVDFDGITSTWSNAISGAGGLIKQGSGTLILDNSSTYSGATEVLAGELRIAGNNAIVSNVTIGPAGTLSGYARVGTLHNNGTLRLDQPAFNVTGDYRQSSQARLAVLLSSPLYVEGIAHLDGELHVLGLKPGYVNAASENIIAANGIVGQFAELTTAASVFLTGSLSYTDTDVWLNITRLDVTAAAKAMGRMSSASLASAARMEGAFRQIDSQVSGAPASKPIAEAFVDLAGEFQQAGSAEVGKASLASLSGELHAAADAMTFDAIGMNRRALSSRFDQLIDQPRRRGDWYQRLGEAGQGSYGGNDFRMDGWMLGSDLRLGEYGVAGAAFGEIRAHNQVDGGRRDRSQDRQAQGQIYLGSVRGQAYALGQLGFGRYDRQMRRELLLGQAYRGVISEYSGDFLSAGLEAGYRLGTPALAVTPYLGVDYARVARDGFAEAGASGFGLRTEASQGERTQAIAGLRMAWVWDGGLGRGFGLRGYAEWQQTLAAHGLGIDASFVGIEAWAPLAGISPEVSGGVFGVGVDSHLTDAATLSFGYDQGFGPRDSARMLSAKFAVGF